MPRIGSRRSRRSTNGHSLQPCPSCGHEASSSGRFCPACGAPLTVADGRERSTASIPDPASERVGDEVAGFRLERLIGHGGMGVVFLARQLKLDRAVALKLIAPEFARDPALRPRFTREALAAATLDSPYVVPVYDAGEAGGELYIAMRYVEGSDLGAVLAAEGVLDPSRAARIVSQVASALDTAHEQSLVHRDVKPGNILLSSSGSNEIAYLSDFGLLRRLGEESAQSASGRWVGTLDYAVPEQIEGRPVDKRADVYALGCVLYRALAGQVPFRRETPTATMWAHVNEPPPDPRVVRPELPAAFAEIVATAMAKHPAERFRTAGELGRAAVAAAEGKRATLAVPFKAPLSRLSNSWSGSGAFTATHREPAPAAQTHDRGVVRALTRGGWWRKLAIAGVAAAIVGALVALLASGVLSSHHDKRLAAVRTTARRSLALANDTDASPVSYARFPPGSARIRVSAAGTW